MTETPDPFAERPYVPPTAPTEPPARSNIPVSPEAAPPQDGLFTHRFSAAEPPPPAGPPAGAQPVAPPPVDPPTAVLPPQSSYPSSYPLSAGAAPNVGGGPRDGDPPRPSGHQADHHARRPKSAAIGFLTAALIGGAAGIGGSAVYDRFVKPEIGSVSSLESPLGSDDDLPADATERAASILLPSVVEVAFKTSTSGGRGTGIIISSDGKILTNNHVVERVAKSGSLSVTFNDGSKAKAKILGRDPFTDTAVIKAEGESGLKPAVLGDSSTARPGEPVVVVGSPFGLSGSVTSGIISAVNRPQAFADGDGQLESSFPAIQTDAAFNVGNSGGPLADLQGRVLGINTVILSSGGGFDGVGFAIPINVAKNSARYLEKGEPAQHARIGISLAPIGDDDDFDQTPAEVKDVTKGSAGAKAGLRSGDLITKIDDVRITSNVGVIAAIRGYRPGQTVTVTYERGGKTRTTRVTLDSDKAAGAPKD